MLPVEESLDLLPNPVFANVILLLVFLPEAPYSVFLCLKHASDISWRLQISEVLKYKSPVEEQIALSLDLLEQLVLLWSLLRTVNICVS